MCDYWMAFFGTGNTVVTGDDTKWCTDTKHLSKCKPEKCSELCEYWYGPSDGNCKDSSKCECSWPC